MKDPVHLHSASRTVAFDCPAEEKCVQPTCGEGYLTGCWALVKSEACHSSLASTYTALLNLMETNAC